MLTPDTYLQFHVAFVVPPIVALAAATRYRRRALSGPVPLAGIAIVGSLALAYTTPWDNLLIERGVWWYGDGATWRSIWAAPVGEYLFFVLQPILTGLFCYNLAFPTDTDLRIGAPARAIGAFAGAGVSAVGAVLLLSGPSTLYLGALLLWAGPVFAIQWAFGWPHLWRARRAVATAVAVPTAYLWIADRTALELGLWSISATHTVGIEVLGLPVEEALFFLVTNLFVVQGLVLYVWLLDRHPAAAFSLDPSDDASPPVPSPGHGGVEATGEDDPV